MAIALILAALLPFAEGNPVFHATAVPPFALSNTVIRLHFDFAQGIVYGQETATVRTRQALRVLAFDSLGIHYRKVTINGRPATYAVDESRRRVEVRLPHSVQPHTRVVVSFTYWAQPTRGMYFIRPDRAYPHVNPEIWTQGEPTDNRRWFPTWDQPNGKTPSELIVTVPRGWTVVANGSLKSHTASGESETWDWISPRPKSTYLIAFAAGRFDGYHTHLGALPIDSYVAPRDAALNALCFRNTPRMIAYYQRIIGFPYPFAKYDQIAVERFTFGGMENASNTILTDAALHPAVEDTERSCDHLISHELAQQWWGDDVTMSDWSNEWINEGFATYFDELWTGQSGGQAAFEFARHQGEEAYFDEAQQYQRPIVDYRYNDPLDLFDVSGHARAAAVLHMLRYVAGDRAFFAALHTYLRHYEYKNASTDQFFESVGTSLHVDLTWFKNEWFYRASYPHYYVSDSYDAKSRVLTLLIEQRNADGKPFRMPVVIAVYFQGHVIQRRINVVRNRQSVQIGNVGAPPDMVLFDPNENLLRELTFPQPVTRLAFQARHARHVADREWALSQLAALRVTSAIARAARSDPFYGVRADAVASAARLGDSATVLAALRDRDVRVRIAAENASMHLPGPNYSLISALRGMTQDANPDVTDAAYTALGALRAPDAYALLTRVRAFRGLALLGDARALPFLVAKTAYGVPERERNAAVAALAQLARGIHHPEVALPVLLRLAAHDPLVSTRLAAVSALGELGDAGAVPTLRQIENGDTQELVRIQAWNALMTLSPMTILPSGWVLSPPQGAAVATGTMPQGMALSPDGTRLAVVEAGYNAPALSIYRLPNLAHVASIPLRGAFGRPVWTDHIHVAIAGANTDAVLVVDVKTKTVGRIALPKKTYPLYIASAQNGLYAVATARDEAVRIAPLHGLGTARPVHLGGFPGGLAFSPDGSTLFATDRSNSRLVAIDARTLRIEARAFTRLHPCAVVVSGRRMYVAESDADAIGVFEYAAHRLREIAQISVADRTPGHELGVSPNSLFAAGKTIYATLGAANSVAVIRDGSVLGRLAAGWYPTDVLTVTDRMYVLNGKGEGARPNPYLRPGSDRDYIAAIEFGSLRQYALPKRLAPDGNPQGAFGWSADPPPSPIRAGGPIKHVIFILKENRTYDQILGDVAEGRGDPQLAWFGGTTTPNEHALARRFGLFDDAYTNGEVSAVGHMWSDAAFSNDSMERFWPSIYANRNDLDALAQVDDLLSDSAGFLWDAARRAHVSFRDYGELVNPGKTAGEWVAAVPSLKGRFDPHYAGWDLHISDTERVREWRREFQGFVRSGRLPQFEFVWLPNDHTAGSKPGELTPPAYVAQNDYALGQIVDTISHSRVWRSSAIFVIEDDAQAGPDHISDQRTTLFIASPYARPGVHHEHYTTASVLRTIEIVLGLKPLSTYDAMAVPMGSVFTQTPDMRPYDVIAPQIDVNRRNAATAFGAQQSAHLDFSRPDAASPRILNEILAHNH